MVHCNDIISNITNRQLIVSVARTTIILSEICDRLKYIFFPTDYASNYFNSQFSLSYEDSISAFQIMLNYTLSKPSWYVGQ